MEEVSEQKQGESNNQAAMKIISITELFVKSWKLFMANLARVSTVAIFGLIVYFLYLLLQLLGLTSLLYLVEQTDSTLIMLVYLILISLVYSIFLSIFMSFIEASMIIIFRDNKKEYGVWQVFKRSWQILFSFWWVGILFSLLVNSGLILLIVPGVIFIIWFIFGQMVMADQNIGGMQALFKSKWYVSDRWLEVFIRLFLLSIAAGVIYFVLAILSGIMSAGLGMIVDVEAASILVSLFEMFLLLLVSAYGTVYSYLLYKDLVKLKGDNEFVYKKSESNLYIVLIVVMMIIPLLIIIFASYAIGTVLKTAGILPGNDYQSILSVGEEENNGLEYDMSSANITYQSASSEEINQKIDEQASMLSKGLEEYYDAKGYYPYKDLISEIWADGVGVLDSKPELPTECGEINNPGVSCGIMYDWMDKDSYLITIYRLNQGVDWIKSKNRDQ